MKTDPTGDQQAPGTTHHDIQSISFAEPFAGAGVNRLVVTLKVASLPNPLPTDTQWKVYFTHGGVIYWVAMVTDISAAATFEYGTSANNIDTTVGALDAGAFSADGTITMTIANSKVGNPSANQTLTAINSDVYQLVGVVLLGLDGTTAPDGTYTLIGNAACGVTNTPTPTATPTVTATPTPTPTPGDDPKCTVPGVEIMTDPAGDPIGMQAAHDVRSLRMAEPGSLGSGKIMFILKVSSLSGPLPPETYWPVQFNVGGTTYVVRMSTVPPGTPAAPRFEFFAGMLNTIALADTADPASNYTSDGTIQLVLPRSAIGSPAIGSAITNFLVRTSIYAGAVFANQDTMPNDAVATGSYTLVGSEVCAGGGTPTPTPTPSGTPAGPRFFNYYAPPGVLEDAGEPTMGVNWNTENVSRPKNANPPAQTFKTTDRVTGLQTTIGNGGTSLYYGGVNSIFLRANFDDCSSPAGVNWGQIPLVFANTTRAFYDPILYTDHWTGRTFVCQEAGLTPGGSTMEFTDDDGDNMYLSNGGAPSGGIDHQTVGGGPLRAPAPPTTVTPKIPSSAGLGGTPIPDPGATPYPHGVYYGSQNVGSATNELSVDGGFTFPIQTPYFTAKDCVGLHGHVKIAEDGTAYLPDKACAPNGVPFVTGGHPSVLVSENNGASWVVRVNQAADSDAAVDDNSVGVSWCPPGPTCTAAEKIERSKHIYMGFMYTGGRPGVAYSNDKGVTWVRTTDLGAQEGIKFIAFPTVSVGDPGRAVFAFFGTKDDLQPGESYSGGPSGDDVNSFSGVFHLYAATTYDFGVTWTVQNISPEGPIQRGPICGAGTCRNLLDFFDSQIDRQGRILIAGEDGCTGGCELGGANSFAAKAFISRQSGGKRMFSIYDAETAEPALPGAPGVNGTFDGVKVNLTWREPDNGGSPILNYRVYRSENAAGPFSDPPLAVVTQPGYVDNNPPAGDKFYVVTAVNAVGEGPLCKPFAPGGGSAGSPCVLPGLLVSTDLLESGADNDTGANQPPDPRLNAKNVFVAEPFISGMEQLYFTLQVAPSTAPGPLPPNSQWFIIWQRQAPDVDHDRLYVAMVTDAIGTPSFEYGKFGVPTPIPPDNPNTNRAFKSGDADAGSFYDPVAGVIQIRVAKSKFRDIDGAANYQPGSSLSAPNARIFFNRPDPGPRLQSSSNDFSPEGAPYTLVGNAFCATKPVLLRAVSRRTHGPSGDFDIRVFPPPTGDVVPIEPRVSDNGVYHIIASFAAPVTFTNATASGGTVQSATPSGNDVIIDVAPNSEATRVTINLNDATTGGPPDDFAIVFDVIVGDSNLDSRVNIGDTNYCKDRSGQITSADNFVADVNADGRINVGDVNVVKSRAGGSYNEP